MDLPTYLTPWTIGGGVAGLILSVAAIVGLVLNRRSVRAALKQVVSSLFSQIGFFSVVIIVFMVISTLESGSFFDANITHHAIFGLLGYALALGFDLVSVVCMVARLNAQRIHDDHGSRLNLAGVMICAAVSAFANAAGSLQGYNPDNLSHTPAWMRLSAPWLGLVFPALIVVLSMTTDHILDHAPSRGIDVATFRERERKRVDMLQVRLDTERELLKLETELAALRSKREQASGKVRREWVFWHWLRPVVPVPPTTPKDEFKGEIDQALQTLRDALEQRLEKVDTALRTQETQIGTWGAEMDKRLDTLGTQVGHLQGQVDMLGITNAGAHATSVPGTMEDQGPTAQGAHKDQWTHEGHGHMRTQEDRRGTVESGTDAEEQGHAADLILAAFRRLGANTPDTWVAREVGCSRKTVARWKKRFLEQGLLSAPVKRNQPALAPAENKPAEKASK